MASKENEEKIFSLNPILRPVFVRLSIAVFANLKSHHAPKNIGSDRKRTICLQ